jgi:type I restriction enzyme M protein
MQKIDNGHSGLLKGLWDSAVRLRGAIEPADYKRYVLPIIFLRFLSLRYEKRRDELLGLTSDSRSDYFARSERQRAEILEDSDAYRAAGTFIVPLDARWESIITAARRDDIKSHLDDVLQLLEDTYPEKLRGLLPRIYAGSNLDTEDLRSLLNIFSREVFRLDHDGTDLIGKVYEYFIGEFANSEGRRGGEYFTPTSIVRTLVAMLEPADGVVFDPCCGAGGMFVQSDLFTHHSHRLSFVGQEEKEFTYRLCRMNLFIHGIDGNIGIGNSYSNDRHADLRADYVIANPPFNDGSKSPDGWGRNKVSDRDPRLVIENERVPLDPRNANTMWILHFLHHLNERGVAGFVMATGELSSDESARLAVRKQLVEADLVDCVVQLPGQLFANTGIACSLWFLARDRKAAGRERAGRILFVDARKLASLIPGSRKQKQLLPEEIDRIVDPYTRFKRGLDCEPVVGFAAVASVEQVRNQRYVLSPGRYVGSEQEEFDELSEVLPALSDELQRRIEHSVELDRVISGKLEELSKVGLA